MLTLSLGETYNRIIDASQKAQRSQSSVADEKGYFIAYENQLIDSPENQYTIKRALGQGSFGRVMVAESLRFGYVALKICRSQQYFVSCMKAEIDTFTRVSQQYPEMTAKLYESFTYKDHVCYTMELFDQTLYQNLKQTQGAGYELPIIRRIARQFGKWLSNMHEMHIVHTDMKPENMVIRNNDVSDIRLIDFGSAIQMDEGSRPTYIQSRFYRAPEITLGLRYDYKIDAWSVGALLLELHTCYTCFPARSSFMLMKMFVSMLGLPPRHLVMIDGDNMIRQKVEKYFVLPTEEYWEQHCTELEQVGQQKGDYIYLSADVLDVEFRVQCKQRDIKQLIINNNHQGKQGHSPEDYRQFLDLLRHLLVWDGSERWGGEEILSSEFCAQQ